MPGFLETPKVSLSSRCNCGRFLFTHLPTQANIRCGVPSGSGGLVEAVGPVPCPARMFSAESLGRIEPVLLVDQSGWSCVTQEGASNVFASFSLFGRVGLRIASRKVPLPNCPFVTGLFPGKECRRSLETRYLAAPRAARASEGPISYERTSLRLRWPERTWPKPISEWQI